MNICVIGTGYVGLVTGTCFADFGVNVSCVDKDVSKIEMLKRKEGASIEEIAKAFGWQPHTVRGAIAGALKKKLGLDVTSEKVDGRRVYRIEA